jgi:hypothetical protein
MEGFALLSVVELLGKLRPMDILLTQMDIVVCRLSSPLLVADHDLEN